MDFVELGEVQSTYTSLESRDFGAGGQLYGTMDGMLVGDRLKGELREAYRSPRLASLRARAEELYAMLADVRAAEAPLGPP